MRILFNINMIGGKYHGISHDTKMILKMLLQNKNIALDILVTKSLSQKTLELLSKAQLKKLSLLCPKNSKNLKEIIKALRTVIKKEFTPSKIDDDLKQELYEFCSPEIDQKLLDKVDVYQSDITSQALKIRSFLQYFNPKLDIEGYDAVFFPLPLSWHLPDGTLKIVRYHDAIPLQFSHLTKYPTIGKVRFYKELKTCVEQNSYFVCNSLPMQEDLLRIFPKHKLKTCTIPCAVPDDFGYKKPNNKQLNNIVEKYTSPSTSHFATEECEIITFEKKKIEVDSQLKHGKYIITVSKIEPKKNHAEIIRHWESSLFDKGIKLVVVGSPGWSCENTLERMSRYIKNRSIIHLEKVKSDDLQILLSGAIAFMFASHCEGFGIGIVEAARCKVPLLISDIPTHRWVSGNNAIYFDPSHEGISLSETMDSIINSDNKNMVDNSYEYSARYMESNVKSKWVEFFDSLSSK